MKLTSETSKLLIGIVLIAFFTSCKEDDSAFLSPPEIYGVGVDVNDLALTHENEDKLFREFGEPLELGNGQIKLLFHPEFYLPIGYEVKGVSEGVVVAIHELENAQDLNLIVQPDDAPKWRVAYEHVDNVKVSVGDRISIGQVIAEVSPYSPYSPGLGKTSLLIFYGAESRKKGGNTAYCPFLLLHDSVKGSLLSDLNSHIENWEERNGDVFDENDWVEIGCAVEQMSEQEAKAESNR